MVMKSATQIGGNPIKLSMIWIPSSELSSRVPFGSVGSIQRYFIKGIVFRTQEIGAIRITDLPL
jgi:hypothetical protein